jgi:hypothetical protein
MFPEERISLAQPSVLMAPFRNTKFVLVDRTEIVLVVYSHCKAGMKANEKGMERSI